MAVWLIVLISVYSTIGALVGIVGCSFAREDSGCPWYLLPFLFAGFVVTWPIVLIDFAIDDARGKKWPNGQR